MVKIRYAKIITNLPTYCYKSQDKDVGLFFANFDSNEHCVKSRKADGALFICDKTATGKTLQTIKLEEIIEKMKKAINNGQAFGCPLLFNWPMQVNMDRANHQAAVYWAQMDLRYDLEYIWKLQEKDEGQYIFIKLILPYESQKECAEYLMAEGKTHGYLFAK